MKRWTVEVGSGGGEVEGEVLKGKGVGLGEGWGGEAWGGGEMGVACEDDNEKRKEL